MFNPFKSRIKPGRPRKKLYFVQQTVAKIRDRKIFFCFCSCLFQLISPLAMSHGHGIFELFNSDRVYKYTYICMVHVLGEFY